jgi:hypothetical protein
MALLGLPPGQEGCSPKNIALEANDLRFLSEEPFDPLFSLAADGD